jgi:hypothetical protein
VIVRCSILYSLPLGCRREACSLKSDPIGLV